LRHGRVGATDCDVVDLPPEKDDLPVRSFVVCMISRSSRILLMCFALASGFPWKTLSTGHQRAVNFLFVAKAKPVGVGIVDPNG
jgi:hypothetical protein